MPFDPSSGGVDVILGIAALATIVGLVRAWGTFWDDDFTFADRRLATQTAVFVLPPAVVLLHELGHLLTAHALHVPVGGFHYGFFEGSVLITGRRTDAQMWLIAIAGNLVSIVCGLGLVAVASVGRRLRRPLRYTLFATGMIELVFSLVGYPVLSLAARFGDWTIIYDLHRTPGLSRGAGLVHVAALAALWRWWRRRGRAALFSIGSGGEGRLAELQKAIDGAPADPGPRLELADHYARRGELALARVTVEDGISACGDTSRLLLGLARLSMFQRRWNDAVVAARRGLQADSAEVADEVRQALWANLALALTQMERPEHALGAYEHLTSPLADDVRVRYGRGLVLLASGQGERGRADLESVVSQLPEDSLLRKWAEARLQGRVLKEWTDSRAPAYQRGGPPPPAPLAGL